MANQVSVPAAPFRKILRERFEKIDSEGRTNAYVRIAAEVGISDRRVRSILSRNQERVSFDTADKIVTRLKGPMLWHLEPELIRIYKTVKL